MVDPVSSEDQWRLLFDIALSHGESHFLRLLSYSGFVAFLHSAELFGPKTSVFPALVERLWRHHKISYASARAAQRKGHRFSDSVASDEAPSEGNEMAHPKYAAQRDAVYSHGVVRLEGFTDMMKVISVRCYQSSKCAHLVRHEGQSLDTAIMLSAEDHVRLDESVRYTATHYLKNFIRRNTVHRDTVVRLDPTHNPWTQNVNRLVTHIVGDVLQSTIMPLFHRYAVDGGICPDQYEHFVRDVFPTFSRLQMKSALAIFHYKEFLHLDSLPVLSNTAPAVKERSSQALELDAFVDAMLMLAVVAYADEKRCPHHRCISGKIWSAFQNYFCPAAGGAPMARDPLFTLQFSSVSPELGMLYPTCVPVDRILCVLVGGLNLLVDATQGVHGSMPLQKDGASDADQNDGLPLEIPPNALQRKFTLPRRCSPTKRTITVVSSQASGSVIKTVSSVSSDTRPADVFTEAATPENTEVSLPMAVIAGSQGASPTGVSRKAVKLFSSEYERSIFSEFDSPIYGMRRCTVYVDENQALGRQVAPNRVEVQLPPSLCNIADFRFAVSFESIKRLGIPGSTVGRLTFTPLRQVKVSLRNNEGDSIYSSRTLVLQETCVAQVIREDVLDVLEKAFVAAATGTGACDSIPAESFNDVCCSLHLVSRSAAAAACHTALSSYAELCAWREPSTTIKVLTFPQFVSAVAMLCIRHSRSASDLPDVSHYMSVAFSRLSNSSTKGGTVSGAEPLHAAGDAAANVELLSHENRSCSPQLVTAESIIAAPTIPHNALLDVPYRKAIEKKARATALGQEKKAMLLTLLHGQNVCEDGGALVGVERRNKRHLPAFPVELSTLQLVSPYQGEELEGLASCLKATSQALMHAFFNEEVSIPSVVLQLEL